MAHLVILMIPLQTWVRMSVVEEVGRWLTTEIGLIKSTYAMNAGSKVCLNDSYDRILTV